MKRIEIYKEDDLKLSILVNDFNITTYINSIEISCKIDDIDTTYTIPFNKGYKVIFEV